jgi:F-type H+-transporting ATPase subunit delta
VHERVRGYTDAVLEDLGRDLGTVASELTAFESLLAGSDELLSALADTTLAEAVRRTIIHELLGKRVSTPTLDLLTFAVQSGAAADFVEDTAGIVVAAAARAEGKVLLDEGPLGRTAAAERLEGYATAVLAAVKERQLGNIEDELFRFVRIVEGNDELRVALTTTELPAAFRQSIVSDLLSRRASAQSARLASYAARIGRPRDYPLLLEGLVERVAKEANRRVADVRSASDMTDAERVRLAGALARLTGYPVEVRVTPQPDLLGGFVAAVGDLVVDASLRHKLEKAKDLLAAPAPPPSQAASGGGAPSSETSEQ